MKSLDINRLLRVQSQIDEWSSQFYDDDCADYDSELASFASCISAAIEEFYEHYSSDDASSDMAFLHIK